MAINVTLIDASQPTVATALEAYESPPGGNGTRIIAFTASLLTGTENYRVFIGLTAVVAAEIIPARSITGPNASSPLELVNHFIPPGEKIFIQVSTGTTITFRASGIEF